MKKAFTVLAIIAFNICLLWVSLVTPILIMASSNSFYYRQFERCGMYERVDEYGRGKMRIVPYINGDAGIQAAFTDEQLNAIADHIVSYLFTDMDSFEMVMDDVYVVRSGVTDGVSIFGDKAVSHMADVKSLIIFARWSAVAAGIAIAALISLFIFKRRHFFMRAFKVSRIFYISLLAFALIFCLWSYVGSSADVPFLLNLWGNLHYLIFAFQPRKYADSFIYDTLTFILNLEFFMNAIIIVVAVVLSVILIWLTVSKLMEKFARKL